MVKENALSSRLGATDATLRDLEGRMATGLPLADLVDAGIRLVEGLLRALLEAGRKPYPADADILGLWKALAKGAPHWNTIRDNCRELVYYRNCLAMGRPDALPLRPERMVLHTARHIALFIKSYAEQNGLLDKEAQ